mgnify:CR=1 FL=1
MNFHFSFNLIVDVLIRTTVVYLFLVGCLLLTGKKEISQLNIIDLVFILLISNSVQNAMVGSSSSLESGLVSASTLFLLNRTLKFLSFRYKPVNKIIEGHPTLLIYKGKAQTHTLDNEKITLEKLQAVVREHGVEKIDEVKLAVLETDGNISVISRSDDDQKSYQRYSKSHPRIQKNP